VEEITAFEKGHEDCQSIEPRNTKGRHTVLMRSGRELQSATRPFIEVSRRQSWWYVGSTLTLMTASLALAGVAPWWPIRLTAAIVGGLIMARAFILYHDFMHGSLLRGSRPAKVMLHGLGLLMLVPPRSWRESHNYHHANVARLNAPAIGSYPIMTTTEWRQASRGQRFFYRLSRHPLTILSAYLTMFGFTITISPLLKNPRRNWDSALSLLVHGLVIAGLWVLAGPDTAFFVLVLPFTLAAALGAYLFYAQHSFPGIKMFGADEWTYYRAALESSSYLKMGRTLSWLLGNIGYHHVHHLNPQIPFYRLPEAMAAIPELQHPTVTTLRLRDIWACLRANLWDEETSQMVSYREAATSTSDPSTARRRTQLRAS
jgi:omega-6 fatty acid desaturase (delta-12 desaturase)